MNAGVVAVKYCAAWSTTRPAHCRELQPASGALAGVEDDRLRAQLLQAASAREARDAAADHGDLYHSEGRARVERKLAMHGDGDLVEVVAAGAVNEAGNKRCEELLLAA